MSMYAFRGNISTIWFSAHYPYKGVGIVVVWYGVYIDFFNLDWISVHLEIVNHSHVHFSLRRSAGFVSKFFVYQRMFLFAVEKRSRLPDDENSIGTQGSRKSYSTALFKRMKRTCTSVQAEQSDQPSELSNANEGEIQYFLIIFQIHKARQYTILQNFVQPVNFYH